MHDDLLGGDRTLWVTGPAGALQVSVNAAADGALLPTQAVAVVCHPHPRYGGTMDNKVVTTLMRTYRDLGVAVVRFNFRGAGASEGRHDDGAGEVEDLLAIVAEVRRLRPGVPLHLAGFSFGAAVAAKACARITTLHQIVLVAPPVPRYQLPVLTQLPAPTTVLQGGLDERVRAVDVAAWARALPGVTYRELPEAGHFFHGQLRELKAALRQAVEGVTYE